MANSNNKKTIENQNVNNISEIDDGNTYETNSEFSDEDFKKIKETCGKIEIKFTEEDVYWSATADLDKIPINAVYAALSQIANFYDFTLIPYESSSIVKIIVDTSDPSMSASSLPS